MNKTSNKEIKKDAEYVISEINKVLKEYENKDSLTQEELETLFNKYREIFVQAGLVLLGIEFDSS
jgi:uncharacterized coiled-coil protein SlyX